MLSSPLRLHALAFAVEDGGNAAPAQRAPGKHNPAVFVLEALQPVVYSDD
jgi:hypothetical protein